MAEVPAADEAIRAAVPDDAGEVARLHVRSWQAAYRGLLPDDFLAGLDPTRRAAQYDFGTTRTDAPHTLVIEHNSRIQGFATVGPCHDSDSVGVGEIYGLYVDPASWRRGLGGLLMADARALLADRGFEDAVLWVLSGNERAAAFYLADGWVQDGAERNDDIGPGWRAASTASCEIPEIHEVRYRRRL